MTLDYEEMTDEWESSNNGIRDINNIAHHYGIFRDIFTNAHFYPVVHMDVEYDAEDEFVNPVYYGNDLHPVEVIIQLY